MPSCPPFPKLLQALTTEVDFVGARDGIARNLQISVRRPVLAGRLSAAGKDGDRGLAAPIKPELQPVFGGANYSER
jgi:hypothetical protein